MPIQWIRSHPEKRLKRHLWSQHDWGIHIADKIASNSPPPPLFVSPGHVTSQLTYQIHHLSVETLLQTLAKHSTYHWSSSHTRLPILYHPKTTWPATNMTTYLRARDLAYSPGITQQPGCENLTHLPWCNRSYLFTSQVLSLSTKPLALRASCVRLLWDWVVTGRKRVLWNPLDSGLCPLCDQAEDLRHILVSCSHHELAQQRRALAHDCNSYIRSIRETRRDLILQGSKLTYAITSLHIISNILQTILELALQHPEGYHYILGSWTPLHINLLLPQIPPQRPPSYSLLRRHLIAFSKIMFHSAILMVKIRNCLHNKPLATPTPTSSTQRRLPAYLPGTPSNSTTLSAARPKTPKRLPKRSISTTERSYLLSLRSTTSAIPAPTSTITTLHSRQSRQTSIQSFFSSSSHSATLPPRPIPPEPPP